MKKSYTNVNTPSPLKRALTFCLCLLLLFPLTACDSLRSKEREEVARYGSEGMAFALDLVARYPFRKAGSAEEKAVADLLDAKLTSLGYEVAIQEFSQGGVSSRNLIVNIPGLGFKDAEEDEANTVLNSEYAESPADLNKRVVIIGAHYDSYYSLHEAERKDAELQEANVDENGLPIQNDLADMKYTESDGIDDNAAAVAALLTIAKELKENPPAFNTRIVFFGAGHEKYAGANYYLDSLSDEELKNIRVMVNVERIYAGDKVYAHAGKNSVSGGMSKNYVMRQSLYICTDIYYNNLLLTNNGFSLYTNQAGCKKELAGVGQAIYREWSETEGNHSPFDRKSIPVVFIESANYDFENCDDTVKQSSNPFFTASEGKIAGTVFDNSSLLRRFYLPPAKRDSEAYFGEQGKLAQEDLGQEEKDELPYADVTDQLEIRINNVAFIICELTRTSPYAVINSP